MPKLLKKLLLSFLIAAYVFLSIPAPIARAKDIGPWYDQGFGQWFLKVYDNTTSPTEIFGERYTAAQVQWVIYGFMSLLINQTIGSEAFICFLDYGDVSTMADECVSIIGQVFEKVDRTSEILDSSESLTKKIFSERPISAITYFKDVGRKLNLVPEAKAQAESFGYGKALYPILPLWKAARNLTYALLVLTIIGIAFMIMFRVKIAPQIVITVQSAIPKIAIALVLITFSYAIAGLLIDLMYVVIGLLSWFFTNMDIVDLNTAQMFDVLTRGPGIGDFRLGLFGFLLQYLFFFAIGLVVTMLASDSAFVTAGLILFGIVIYVVVAIVLLWVMLKISWTLFRTLAVILLSTILAPLQILVGVLVPNMGFRAWLRNYLANLAVFPVAGFLIVLAFIFLKLAIANALKEIPDIGLFLKWLPLAGEMKGVITGGSGGWPPILNMGSEDTTVPFVFLGASFVIMTTVPKTVKLIKSIMTGQEFDYGTAIGQAFGPAKMVGMWGAAEAMNIAEEKEKLEKGETAPPPGWVQAGRRILGFKT